MVIPDHKFLFKKKLKWVGPFALSPPFFESVGFVSYVSFCDTENFPKFLDPQSYAMVFLLDFLVVDFFWFFNGFGLVRIVFLLYTELTRTQN